MNIYLLTKRKSRVVAFAFGTILFVTIIAPLLAPAHAQTGGTYELTWSTIDGGGATFSLGGDYTLGGAMGQADADPTMTSGEYSLAGGFWVGASGGADGNQAVYLPLVIKD